MINDDMLSGLVTHFNGTVEIQSREKVIMRGDRRSSRNHGRPSAEARQKVIAAKDDLIRRFSITEDNAHRLIQRFAMECRIPFEDAADMCRLGLMSLDYLKENP